MGCLDDIIAANDGEYFFNPSACGPVLCKKTEYQKFDTFDIFDNNQNQSKTFNEESSP